MIAFISFFFYQLIIVQMSEIPLNKFEKHDLILRLLSEGKTYRDICHIAHTSPRDIKPIAKEYERKKRLETNSENKKSSTKTKNLSISSQVFKLFLDNKRPTFVAIELDIAPEKAEKLWYQFLKLERREQGYEFFQEFEYNIPGFLTIGSFIKSNHV